MAKTTTAKKRPINLSKFSIAELKSLRDEVDQALDAQAAAAKTQALADAEAAAKSFGFALSDLVGPAKAKTRKARTSKAPVAPKYQHPENPSLTWSGRGRQPRWFKEAVDAGASPDQFLIT